MWDDDADIAAAQAILAAIQADPLAYVKVKPLKWVASEYGPPHYGKLVSGDYTVGGNFAGDGFFWQYRDEPSEWDHSPATAQAAAQLDYETRIREGLV